MKIQIHNVQTGQVIVRDMNEEELAQYEIDQANAHAEDARLAELESARQAILDRLGITAEEAKLLLGLA